MIYSKLSRLFLLVVSLFCFTAMAQSDGIAERPEIECLEQWNKTRSTIQSLFERDLGINNIRIARKCEKLWNTREQLEVYEYILEFEKSWKEKQRKFTSPVEPKPRQSEVMRKLEESIAGGTASRYVEIGMTQDEVRNKLGGPANMSKTTVDGVVVEVWIYGGYPYKTKTLYFQNGLLKIIHEGF